MREVIQAGLKLLEKDKSDIVSLLVVIEEGVNSRIARDFDPKKRLETI